MNLYCFVHGCFEALLPATRNCDETLTKSKFQHNNLHFYVLFFSKFIILCKTQYETSMFKYDFEIKFITNAMKRRHYLIWFWISEKDG